jgi:hypothetical protein
MDVIEPQRDARFGTMDGAGKTPTEEDMKALAAEKEAALAVLANSLDKLSPVVEVSKRPDDGKLALIPMKYNLETVHSMRYLKLVPHNKS